MKFWDDGDDFRVSVNGWKIPLVRSIKFLGVYMDNMLSWHLHINHVMEKLNNNRRLLQLGKKFLNTHCRCNVYFGHIHSHLVYGIPVWGSMVSESQLSGIRKIQDQCICFISSKKHDDIQVERCNIHLVYMGFRIFLQLKKRQIPEPTRILGTISSEDPAVRVQMPLLVKTEKPDGDERPLRGNSNAAAGSESQLHRVEQELNQHKSRTDGCELNQAKQCNN